MSTVDILAPARTSVPLRRSLAIYLALMGCLVLIKVALELGSVEAAVPSQATLFSWPMIGFLTLAGACSVWLGPRAGLPGVWEASVPPRKRLLLPAVVGLGLGAVFLSLDAVTGYAQVVAEAANVTAINVPFPESILFYSGGAIIVETLYRLILITVPLWLIGSVILRRRRQAVVFWAVASLTSLVEPLGQASLVAGHTKVMLILGAGMYAINLFEAYLFRRCGFLAPLVHRLAFYLVWHGVGSVLGL